MGIKESLDELVTRLESTGVDTYELEREITDFYVINKDEILNHPDLVVKFTGHNYESLSPEENKSFKKKILMDYFEKNPSVDDTLFVLRGRKSEPDTSYPYSVLKLFSDEEFEKLLEGVKDKKGIILKIVSTLYARDLEKYPTVIKFAYLNSPENEFISSLKSLINFSDREEDSRLSYLAHLRGVKDVDNLIEKFGLNAVEYALLNNENFEEVNPQLAELMLADSHLRISYMSSQKYGNMFEDMRKEMAVLIGAISDLKKMNGVREKDPYFELSEEDKEHIFCCKYGENPILVLNQNENKKQNEAEDQKSFLDETYNAYINFVKEVKSIFDNAYNLGK